jgi:general secretion pathway protein F/MSHA biogenesis protein MshG
MAQKYFEIEFIQGGKKHKETIQAGSKTEAIIVARDNLGYKVLKAKEVSAPLLKALSLEKLQEIFTQKKITLDAQISAIRQMSVMANAGLSFTDILKEAISATDNDRLREILTQNLNDINAGLSLSQSLKQFEKDVGKLMITMVELGEKTGTMAESLDSLAEILEEVRDNRAKIKKALRYPISVVVAMILAFTILIIVVVPKFKSIFDKFKADLPLPTKILLGMESFLSNYGFLLLAFLVLTYIGIKYIYNTNEKAKLKMDEHILKAPIIGILLSLGLVSRFTIVFKELNKAGLPVIEALSVSSKGVENSFVRGKLMQVAVNVQRGLSLTAALKEADIYENMIIQMLGAGEQSGSLTSMLDKTADYYRQKFQNKMDGLSAAIEPILIGGIAGFVLLLALGIFMPMWDMAQVVKK